MVTVKVIPKQKRRKKGSGKHPPIVVRCPPELIAKIDKFAERHAVTRSESLRHLAEIALRCQAR